MRTFMTMSTKGQFTLPAHIRKAMNIKNGDILDLTYHVKSRSIELKKPMSIEEISAKLTSYIKPGTKPLHDVDDYYQKHRKPRV